MEEEPEQTKTINIEEPYIIPIMEIPEKQMQDFINAVERMPQKLLAYMRTFTGDEDYQLKKIPILYQEIETGRIKKGDDLDIWLPVKNQGEMVLWYRTKHEGVLNKKLRGFDVVTNYRAYYWDLTQPYGKPWFLGDGGTDVVITNQKRYSTSERQGSFAGFGARGTFVGSTGGSSSSESQTIGDVNLMNEGQIDFTFFSVEDPHGLASLIKNVIKNHAELFKKLGEQEKNDKKELTDAEKNLTNCQKCGAQNPSKSRFCNKCGTQLGSVCTKCGANNPDESSFCNKCGFALK